MFVSKARQHRESQRSQICQYTGTTSRALGEFFDEQRWSHEAAGSFTRRGKGQLSLEVSQGNSCAGYWAFLSEHTQFNNQ